MDSKRSTQSKTKGSKKDTDRTESFIKAYNKVQAAEPNEDGKVSVIDVSNLLDNGTGWTIKNAPVNNYAGLKWIGELKVVSNNYDKYHLALNILGRDMSQKDFDDELGSYLDTFAERYGNVGKIQSFVEFKRSNVGKFAEDKMEAAYEKYAPPEFAFNVRKTKNGGSKTKPKGEKKKTTTTSKKITVFSPVRSSLADFAKATKKLKPEEFSALVVDRNTVPVVKKVFVKSGRRLVESPSQPAESE